jgi:hypothetical protein
MYLIGTKQGANFISNGLEFCNVHPVFGMGLHVSHPTCR